MKNDILKTLTQKKKRLDALRPLPQELLTNLEEWYRVELTYTSNAIEGNTLSRAETALVVEKGLTVAGKTLTEHLEATNHAQALEFVKKLAGKKSDITERDILNLHQLILQKIDDTNAGRLRTVSVRIAGSTAIMPNPMKVPYLMEEFAAWLRKKNTDYSVKIAADVHFKLVSIHPFVDGNGRVGRLLMNLFLMRVGYPPAVIRKEDRKVYIDSLEKGQTTGEMNDYYTIVYKAVERSLNMYLDALSPQKKKAATSTKLLKIGEIAKLTGETVHTIRFWTKEGLLDVADSTSSGYQLYKKDVVEKIKEIRRLQHEKRLTLDEIRKAKK